MPWLDPNAKRIEDSGGAGVDEYMLTSLPRDIPGPSTISGRTMRIKVRDTYKGARELV
jgi:hypothetical protein